MYDLISDLINHDYVSNYSGDQQYIYTACVVLIILGTCIILNGIFQFFKNIFGG